MTGSITLRVPDEELDAFLQTVASFATHVKSKTVKAEDVSLNLVAEKLSVKRARTYGKRVENAIAQNNILEIKEISHRMCPMFKQIQAYTITEILDNLELKELPIATIAIDFEELKVGKNC